jgi:hypothetical protein
MFACCIAGYDGDGKKSGSGGNGCSAIGGWPEWFALRHASNACVLPTLSVNSFPGEGDTLFFGPCSNDSNAQWQQTMTGALRNKRSSVCLTAEASVNATAVAMTFRCSDPGTAFVFNTTDGTLRHVASGKCVNPSPVTFSQNLSLEDCPASPAQLVRSDLDFCDSSDFGSPTPCVANATCTPVPGTNTTSASATCACPSGKTGTHECCASLVQGQLQLQKFTSSLDQAICHWHGVKSVCACFLVSFS